MNNDDQPYTARIQFPAIHDFEDLIHYTGRPFLPDERPDPLTEKQRKRGGKPARKVISGVRAYIGGTRKTATWRARIHKSTKHSRNQHKAFTYDCSTREEAVYIATMAHFKLKPWFFKRCQEGIGKMPPARPGDPHYFWNDIWGLWRYVDMTGVNGDRFIALAIPGVNRCFCVDYREDIYAALVRAPFFCRGTVKRKRVYEPVQPRTVRTPRGGLTVEWTGLSEVVLGEKVNIRPHLLSQFDYRREMLMGKSPPPLFPAPGEYKEGWSPRIEPLRFNAVTPGNKSWIHHHPYGCI